MSASNIFDAVFGGMATEVINELAPTTRRDDWWASEAPSEIIARALRDAWTCGAAGCDPDELARRKRQLASRVQAFSSASELCAAGKYEEAASTLGLKPRSNKLSEM